MRVGATHQKVAEKIEAFGRGVDNALGPAWRFGLQDLQQRAMGEYASTVPSQPGMAGSLTPAEADRQLYQEGKDDVGVKEPEQQKQMEMQEPQEEMEMG
jgi:hypothetical protein